MSEVEHYMDRCAALSRRVATLEAALCKIMQDCTTLAPSDDGRIRIRWILQKARAALGDQATPTDPLVEATDAVAEYRAWQRADAIDAALGDQED